MLQEQKRELEELEKKKKSEVTFHDDLHKQKEKNVPNTVIRLSTHSNINNSSTKINPFFNQVKDKMKLNQLKKDDSECIDSSHSISTRINESNWQVEVMEF